MLESILRGGASLVVTVAISCCCVYLDADETDERLVCVHHEELLVDLQHLASAAHLRMRTKQHYIYTRSGVTIFNTFNNNVEFDCFSRTTRPKVT